MGAAPQALLLLPNPLLHPTGPHRGPGDPKSHLPWKWGEGTKSSDGLILCTGRGPKDAGSVAPALLLPPGWGGPWEGRRPSRCAERAGTPSCPTLPVAWLRPCLACGFSVAGTLQGAVPARAPQPLRGAHLCGARGGARADGAVLISRVTHVIMFPRLSNHLGYLYPAERAGLPSPQRGRRMVGAGRSLGGTRTGRRQPGTPHPLPWGATPARHPKITATVPAQQDGPGSMASIPGMTAAWGGGIPFPSESPVWKNKEGKAENFSFHQNRKELGGWGTEGAEIILQPAVVSGGQAPPACTGLMAAWPGLAPGCHLPGQSPRLLSPAQACVAGVHTQGRLSPQAPLPPATQAHPPAHQPDPTCSRLRPQASPSFPGPCPGSPGT